MSCDLLMTFAGMYNSYFAEQIWTRLDSLFFGIAILFQWCVDEMLLYYYISNPWWWGTLFSNCYDPTFYGVLPRFINPNNQDALFIIYIIVNEQCCWLHYIHYPWLWWYHVSLAPSSRRRFWLLWKVQSFCVFCCTFRNPRMYRYMVSQLMLEVEYHAHTQAESL